jgi:hypothetical protein
MNPKPSANEELATVELYIVVDIEAVDVEATETTADTVEQNEVAVATEAGVAYDGGKAAAVLGASGAAELHIRHSGGGSHHHHYCHSGGYRKNQFDTSHYATS